MPAITVRNVPAATRDELALRAARSGRSLQEYLLQMLIEAAERPDKRTVLDRVQARKRATGTRLDPAEILELLDADRP